jgi:hypothetical protein
MSKQQHLPDILLERYVLNELDKKEKLKIKTLAQEDKTIQKRIKDIELSNKKILSRYPAQIIAASIKAKLASDKPLRQHAVSDFFLRPLPLAGLATACLVILAATFILPLFRPSESVVITEENETTRIKGSDINYNEPALFIFRKNNTQEEKLKDGSTVFAHDTIQIQYFAATDKYGIIFSIDGRGMITLHFPDQEQANTMLSLNKKVLLENSFELDDAPSFERFFFITSNSPINVTAVLNKAKQITEDLNSALKDYLDLPKEYKQTTITLLKGEQ